MSKFAKSLDKFFEISKRESTIGTEIVAGITTFMAMAYILIVNTGMFGALSPEIGSAVYIATAISGIIGTLVMGLYAKLPFAQASGMGLNAYFVFTVCFGFGYSYANALMLVLMSGILFFILTVIGVREKIVLAVPKSVKLAIPAGIGVFIAFLGLQNCGLIVGNPATLVSMAKLDLFNVPFFAIFPVICTLIGFLSIAILSKFKVKGSIIFGILIATALYYIMGYAGGFLDLTNKEAVLAAAKFLGVNGEVFTDTMAAEVAAIAGSKGYLAPVFTAESFNPITAFVNFGKESFGKVFTQGFKFGKFSFGKLMEIFSVILAFAMVDMFDTIGTLLGTASKANMLDENGNLPEMKKALFADSTATIVGAICGTSTVTTYVESASGVAEGGRTGLTAVVVACCFFVAMFLSPLALLIPSCATATALIYVGVLMVSAVKEIDFSDVAISVPAFLTITMMAFTYNISFGIGLGLISHVVIYTAMFIKDAIQKKSKEEMAHYKQDLSPITIILAVLFLVNFFMISH